MFTRELCLMSRKKITLLYAKRYRKARRKKEKSEIVNAFVNSRSNGEVIAYIEVNHRWVVGIEN